MLHLLFDDNGVINMVNIAKCCGHIHLFLIHGVDEPEVKDGDGIGVEAEVGGNDVVGTDAGKSDHVVEGEGHEVDVEVDHQVKGEVDHEVEVQADHEVKVEADEVEVEVDHEVEVQADHEVESEVDDNVEIGFVSGSKDIEFSNKEDNTMDKGADVDVRLMDVNKNVVSGVENIIEGNVEVEVGLNEEDFFDEDNETING
ncbi:hypothetical protein LR48_Vigan09g044400 [Vigna angularis]|uniref:Uncharacterized protein n=1 Tax=Phaseolus angularis TaxID=3914 RepID=A0A0L9V9L1_PHAAN|nr:hypothetical protein LR48_Vigan09g044400 [Vigna angularis]